MKLLSVLLCVLACLTFRTPVSAQSSDPEYYVTIGVFAVPDNAVRYTTRANKLGFNAQYAINPAKNMHYVYLLQTSDRKKAFSFMIKVRAESEFKDAWLFIGHLGNDEPAAAPIPLPIVSRFRN